MTSPTPERLHVEGMLSRLIAGRQLGDLATVIESLVPDRTFMDARTRDLFEVLTGDKLSKAPEWKPYHIHVERRNRLVHSAHRVSMGEAQASLVAVECFLDHLTVIRGLPAM